MLVTQKCQYALKAVFSLARTGGDRPIKIAQIAEEQSIPFRFLEVILSQLKQGGFVESRRGTDGGYLLAMRPDQIRVGDIVRFVDGPNFAGEPFGVEDRGDGVKGKGNDIFSAVWRQARSAVFEVFDGTTLADLLARDEERRSQFAPNFTI